VKEINVKEIGSVSNTVNHETIIQGKENVIKEPKIKLEESRTTFRDLKEESQFCERILTEELDPKRPDNYRLHSQAEYNEEKIKFYKSQITVLEERNKSYNLTTSKNEQINPQFKDEVLVTQDEIFITEEDLEHPKRNKDKTPGVTVTNKRLDVSDKEKLKIVNSNDQDNQGNRNDKQLNITENTEEVESQKKVKITYSA
jgi:hypothetical protein